MTDAEEKLIQRELKAFFDDYMRLIALPAKHKKQLMGFYYIASKLREDGVWNERELNDALNEWHTFGDPALIRRTLVDLGMLDRDPRGTRYTLRQPIPSLAEFLARGL